MAGNPIESLIVELGLDASGLNEESAKAAIGNIKASVTELNTALKETEKLLGAIGKVPSHKPVAAAAQPTPVAPAVPVTAKPADAAHPVVPPVAKPAVQPAPAVPAVPVTTKPAVNAPPAAPPVATSAAASREEAAKKRREATFLKWKGKQEMKAASALRAIEAQTTSQGLERIIASLEDSLANLGTAEASGILSGHQARVQRGLLKDVLGAAQAKKGVVVKAEADRKSEEDKKEEEDAAATAAEKAERARQKVEREAQRQRDREAKRRMPHSLGGLIRSIPGLGTIAAGLYIARQAFDAVAGFVGKITETMKGGQNIRTAAQSFGIATDRMQGFTDAAVQFGANSNEIAQDMSKFMSGAQIPIGGQYHWGLARKGVAVSEGGHWRKMEDIMGDLADVMSKEPKLNKDTYNYYRHMFGFSKQTVDFMQQGREGIEKMRLDAINRGLALSGELVQRQAYQAQKWNEIIQRFNVAAKKISLFVSEELLGREGESQGDKFKRLFGLNMALRGDIGSLPMAMALGVWRGSREGGKDKQVQQVQPSYQSIYYANGSKQQAQQMTVNVSVDKGGAATTSVKGVDRKNVSTNVLPYKVAQ